MIIIEYYRAGNHPIEKCDNCVFGRYYTSDGNANRVCSAKPCSDEEAIQAVLLCEKTNTCKYYDEGHALLEEYRQLPDNGKHLTASQQWKYDRCDFSETPVAECHSFHNEPDTNCWRQENGYCYCRLECSAQVRNGKPVLDISQMIRNVTNKDSTT